MGGRFKKNPCRFVVCTCPEIIQIDPVVSQDFPVSPGQSGETDVKVWERSNMSENQSRRSLHHRR